jgi:outer membrane protein TolC
MIGGFVRRLGMTALVMLTAFGATGCFPTRTQVYSELEAARQKAYARWRGQADQEGALPRVDGELTVEESVKLALQYNPSLQSVLMEREKARGRIYTAYGEALPTVELSADYTRLDQGPLLDYISGATGDRDNLSAQVTVTQPLFKGGSIGAAMKGARYYQFLNDEIVRQAVQEIALQTALAYYEVVLAQKLLRVQTEALEFAQANLKDVTAREKAGVAIPFDRLRAQVEVSNVEADLIQERNHLNRARTSLLRTMGVSQKSDVTQVSELVYVPLEPDLEKTVEAALLNRPELYRSELNVLVQQAALRVAMADYFPRLEGSFWEKWARPNPHDIRDSTYGRQWQAGLRLTWTLFDGLRREGNIIQQRAALRQSGMDLAASEQKVFEEVKNALFDLTDAEELVKSQEFNLKLAGEALRLVAIGAKQGVNTELEVLDARSALTKARGNYYTALHAHLKARLTLQRAIGLLGPAPGAAEVPKEAPSTDVLNQLVQSAQSEAAAEPSEGAAAQSESPAAPEAAEGAAQKNESPAAPAPAASAAREGQSPAAPESVQEAPGATEPAVAPETTGGQAAPAAAE